MNATTNTEWTQNGTTDATWTFAIKEYIFSEVFLDYLLDYFLDYLLPLVWEVQNLHVSE